MGPLRGRARRKREAQSAAAPALARQLDLGAAMPADAAGWRGASRYADNQPRKQTNAYQATKHPQSCLRLPFSAARASARFSRSIRSSSANSMAETVTAKESEMIARKSAVRTKRKRTTKTQK